MYGATTPETRWFCFLFRLLCLNRALGATDARDKVYSVLGLTNLHLPKDSPQLVVSGYHLTAREIYISVSGQVAKSIPYLAILSEVHDRPGYRNESVPSWVPDYASMAACEPFTRLGGRELSSLSADETEYTQPVPGGVYNASLARASDPAFRDVQGDVLLVNGARFAKVEEVSISFDLVFVLNGIFPMLDVCSRIDPICEANGQSRVGKLYGGH